jgi:hypothetical protein
VLECWSASCFGGESLRGAVFECMRRTLATPWEQLCGASRGAREREPDRIVGALGAAAGAGVLAPSEDRGRRCELLKGG